MGKKVKIDPAGIAAIAKGSQMQALVNEAAAEIAGNIQSLGILVGDRNGGPREVPLPVKVTSHVTDRAHATVILAHPAGIAVQAKHGALTKAAAAAGLDVKAKR